MTSEVTFTFKDYTRENSNCRFAVSDMTAADFDAVNIAIGNLRTALLALQNEDCIQQTRIVSGLTRHSGAAATQQASQRESKWLLMCEDAVLHTLFRHEIPIAKASLLANHSEYLDLSAGVGATFKTAFEAIVNSPAGNGANLSSVQFVGKRL